MWNLEFRAPGRETTAAELVARAWHRATPRQRDAAFAAGEVGAIEVLRAQDDFVGVTQGYYDALLEYHEAAAELAKRLPQDAIVLVCLSGRGDKDIDIVAAALGEGSS